MTVQFKTAKTVHTAIQLQVLNQKLTMMLDQKGIRAITLKGCAVAKLYPVPEFRKTKDIDLFVSHEEEDERVVQVLSANGFKLSGE